MQLSIDLPNSFELYNRETLLEDIQLGVALLFFSQKKVSVEKAAQIAKLSIFEFQKECKKFGIYVVNYSSEDLENEVIALRKELNCR